MILTRNEIFYLDDSCTLLVKNDELFDGYAIPLRGVEMSAKIGVPGDLIVKLGSKVLEVLEDDKSGTDIDFSLDELFLLRELAHSQVKYGTEFVGLSLKKKIYGVLISMINKEEADDLINGLGLGES